MTTLTLVDFLRARLDEDEQTALSAGHGCRHLHEHSAGWVEIDLPSDHNARPSYETQFIKTFSPDRILADVEAKRAVVELRQEVDWIARTSSEEWEATAARDTRAGLDQALRLLALPYADHPDYDEAWRP